MVFDAYCLDMLICPPAAIAPVANPEMRNVKQGKLPKPATDPVQVALVAIKQLPQETPRSSTYLKQVVEEAIKHPSKLALVEEAALAWGLSPVKALEMRDEAERRTGPDETEGTRTWNRSRAGRCCRKATGGRGHA